jgi:hypothetical protein
VVYPTECDIRDFMAKLPPEIVDEFKPLVEGAQREYRRVRLKNPGNEEGLIAVLAQHAGAVFKTLVAKRLRTRSGDTEEFRRSIGMEGGDAETAMWFVYDLYRMAGDGRMLVVWHRQIEPKLWVLVRQAEDMWWLPDAVVPGWEEFLASHPNALVLPPSPPQPQGLADRAKAAVAAPTDLEVLAQVRQAFVLPLLKHKGWSVTQWAVEAEVDFHTANDYLEGQTTPRSSTRLKLAQALGVPVDQLPT